MDKKSDSNIEEQVNITLTVDNINLVLTAMDAGMININNVQNVFSGVFRNKSGEAGTSEMLNKMGEVRKAIVAQAKTRIKKDFKLDLIKP